MAQVAGLPQGVPGQSGLSRPSSTTPHCLTHSWHTSVSSTSKHKTRRTEDSSMPSSHISVRRSKDRFGKYTLQFLGKTG
ncbi:hypothetical protein E2C01_037052 [Portunus trituberculatus]|uniref:Uncharacterized protein n=1 Tax=Portunus trituberculatus TaxID=210409 RepID=A0A5B7FDL0_PORTR|nr:hypothetical protein [Portunus trituberculatus]